MRKIPFAVVLLLGVAGCSGGTQPVRQKGVVTLEGVPLVDFTVSFMSTENKRPAIGKTDENGRFELMTFQSGDGAIPGEYSVIVSAPPVAAPAVPGAPPFKVDNPQKNPVPAIHPNYSNSLKTPLRRVVPAPEGEIKLELNKNGS